MKSVSWWLCPPDKFYITARIELERMRQEPIDVIVREAYRETWDRKPPRDEA